MTKSAAQFLPERRTLESLSAAARSCQGCDLYKSATQTVFGEGPKDASVMLVGEQPGDMEDRQGHPFVGPAGRLLDKALAEARIPRDEVYITNAVKHFKWIQRGKRRLHQKPVIRQVIACRPWLKAEIEAIHPKVVVCLGAT
ncbi:MAG TPA: UdgX family uracil-DNA binding protein, partial [Candidatus Binatia bacterium]|nr:UdgX family uracil-DNA binding protein [Candidatus Binatia bacterium]